MTECGCAFVSGTFADLTFSLLGPSNTCYVITSLPRPSTLDRYMYLVPQNSVDKDHLLDHKQFTRGRIAFYYQDRQWQWTPRNIEATQYASRRCAMPNRRLCGPPRPIMVDCDREACGDQTSRSRATTTQIETMAATPDPINHDQVHTLCMYTVLTYTGHNMHSRVYVQ